MSGRTKFLGQLGLCVVAGSHKLVVCLFMFSHLRDEECGSLGNSPYSSDGAADINPVEAE